VCEHLEESFKVDPLSVQLVSNVAERLIDILVALVIAEGFGSGDDFTDVGLSAIVSVKVEEGPKILDLFDLERRIGGYDRFREGFFLLLLKQLFLVD
jgi:hypothetical protein